MTDGRPTSGPTGMQTDWQGVYLDGRSAERQPAAIRLLRSGLQISTAGAPDRWWPYREIRQTQGFYAGEQVRLERGGELSEAILIADPAFLAALHRVAPELAGRFHDPAGRRKRVVLTVAAGLAAVGILAALYLWGIPGMAALLAGQVPVSWEERLGAEVVDHLAPPDRRCLDPARLRPLDAIVAALTAPGGKPPYTFRLIVVDHPAVNALAAPGGYIVIFRGLLERTRRAEELAGVLAHELQHVLRRHATRALLQHVSTGLLIAAMTGDASGAMAYGLESARTLAAMRYSRENEVEADVEGMRMLLAAGVDPAGMVSVFEVLRKAGGKSPAFLAYLSTHPETAERIARLRRMAEASRGPWTPLVPDADWTQITTICRSASR